MKREILLSLVIVLCVLLSAFMIPLSAAEQWDNGKLVVSPNGRYLLHENGVPFFWFGDSAWCIFHRLTVDEAGQYFSDRQDKGFTVAQASVLAPGRIQGITEPEHNIVNGELPFFNQNPETPNEGFFQHVDAIIDKAAEYDIYVGLLPVWGEYVCPAHQDGPKIFDETNAQVYGEWIGNRYKDKPNIIWIMGGDRDGDRCGSDDLAIWRAMANGIRSVDNNHMITYHPAGRSGSYEWFNDDAWLDFNMIESHSSEDWIYTGIENGYDMVPSKPVVNGEPAYYNLQDPIAGVDPPAIGECAYYEPLPERHYRSQPYWTTLAGGTGYTFGQIFIWVFEKSTDGNDLSTTNSCDYDLDWHNYLDTDGTLWAVYWSEFFRSIDWWELVPDQSIIMTNERFGADRKVAAKSSDGGSIVVYYATRETARIDLRKITTSSEAQAKWWNPADKSESIIGTVSTTSGQDFIPPSGWEDAVLYVYEDTPTTAAEPAISPNGGTFIDSVSVTLSCSTPGASIRYTTDGSTPTPTSTLYASPLSINEDTTLRARASKDGMVDSDITSAFFNIIPGFEPHVLSIPGRIEVEDYKTGGEGVAYHDTTSGNLYGEYRDDDVDIGTTTDIGGGYSIGAITAGEWLAYDVHVSSPGEHNITVRIASGRTGTKTLHIEVDGTDVTGPMSFTDSSGWQSWIDLTASDIRLSAGNHELRIVMDTGGYNLNYVDVKHATPYDYCNGILLLMHFDNRAEHGESPSHVHDFSGNANYGSAYGATPIPSGMFGGAFDFDGENDFIGIAHSDDFLINEGTLSLWFNSESITSENQGLFSKDALGKGTGGHFTLNIEAVPQIRGRLQSTTESSSLYHDIATGMWYHAVVTFGPSGLKMYVNGSLVGQDAYTGGMGTSSGGAGNYEPASIGASTGLSDSLSLQPLAQFFNGTIDEVAVWNLSLSASEIYGLYQRGTLYCIPHDFHQSDITIPFGCIEEHELIPFIDLWKYDSTAYPMREVMEAVSLWSRGTGCS